MMSEIGIIVIDFEEEFFNSLIIKSKYRSTSHPVKMDLDEIKCTLCGLFYDEQSRVPILLPDCGHSFC